MSHVAQICALTFLIAMQVSGALAQQETAPMHFDGFSVDEPPGANWEPHIWEAPSVPIFLVKRFQGDSMLHSAVLKIEGSFQSFPIVSEQGTREVLEKAVSDFWPSGIVDLQMIQSDEVGSLGPTPVCVGYQITAKEEREINDAIRTLTAWAMGFHCKHPLHPTIVLDISYSQRSDKDKWWPEFDEEANAFLRSFVFMPVDIGYE